MTKYLSQGNDSCCFVYALANCNIHLGLPVPDLEKAKDIACCRTGNTIGEERVIEYMKTPVRKVSDYKKVLKNGGILGIMHPIYNGHSFFAFPDGEESITMINSWLGPLVAHRIGWREIEKFMSGGFSQYILESLL